MRGDTGGDLLQVYLAEVARHPLLSRADEVELSASRRKSRADDLVAPLPEQLSGRLLTRSPEG